MKLLYVIFPATAIATISPSVSMGFCSNPMWSIPKVGTDDRCDNGLDGCPKRIDANATPECSDSFGVKGGDSCVVRCANGLDGTDATEVWRCLEDDIETWELVGDELACGTTNDMKVENPKEITAEMWEEIVSGFKWIPPLNGTAAKVGAAGVCEQMVEYIPDECTCEDTLLGGTAHCSVDISTNGTDDDPPWHVDTINMDLELNVCDEPMNLKFNIGDEIFGDDFWFYEVEAGDDGEVGTGILIPLEIAYVELMLSYALGGSIDKLFFRFGFDLMAAVGVWPLEADIYCSSITDACPLWFLECEEDFGDEC